MRASRPSTMRCKLALRALKARLSRRSRNRRLRPRLAAPPPQPARHQTAHPVLRAQPVHAVQQRRSLFTRKITAGSRGRSANSRVTRLSSVRSFWTSSTSSARRFNASRRSSPARPSQRSRPRSSRARSLLRSSRGRCGRQPPLFSAPRRMQDEDTARSLPSPCSCCLCCRVWSAV